MGYITKSSTLLEYLRLTTWNEKSADTTFDTLVQYYLKPLSLLCDIASETVYSILDEVKNKGKKIIRNYDKETIIESLDRVFWLLTEVQINLEKMRTDIERMKMQYKNGEKSPYLSYDPEERLGHLKWKGSLSFESLSIYGSFVVKHLLQFAFDDLTELWSSLKGRLDEKICAATGVVRHMMNRVVDLDALLYQLLDESSEKNVIHTEPKAASMTQ